MSYRELERKKAVEIREKLFRDPGDGIFFQKKRKFVLQDPALNLWGGIRMDAIDYFERNKIAWWMGEKKENKQEPTAHLLSSQVACLNHLYFSRQRKDIATKILKTITNTVDEAVIIDDGFVEFEAIGKENYLKEKSHTRGANCTSVDAIMVGKKENNKNILFLIEWKYTEEYGSDSKYIHQRYDIYNKILSENNCPIVTDNFESLYYEPFYQLMRQTLLGWKMVQNNEYNCDEYLHIHVIPSQNKELLDRVTSPHLKGDSLSEAWKNVLSQKNRYISISPEKLIQPVGECPDTKSIISYLDERYWEE